MKNTNQILKGASVLLIAAVMILSTVVVTANTYGDQKEIVEFEEVTIKTTGSSTNQLINKGVFYDSFESHPDFVVDDFPPWTTYDGDLGATYGVTDIEWPNVGYVGSFMIFNPSQTTPPFDTQPPHSGEKYASCWDTVLSSAPNDDWLFTPQLHMEEDGMLTFWGKSLNDAYGLEEIEVGVSTTDTDPGSFTIISGPVFEVPVDWTEYTYDLSTYTGQDIYIGIHVVSYDVFAFFLDDFEVTGVAIGNPDLDCEGTLTWTDVEPGATVTGDFTVSNIGDPLALLDWEIESYPDWGTWTFDPESGAVFGTVTVEVEVVAPEDPETEFTGEIVLVNSDDPDNTCVIEVVLVTPVSQQSLIFQFFEMLAQRFPILGRILAAIF